MKHAGKYASRVLVVLAAVWGPIAGRAEAQLHDPLRGSGGYVGLGMRTLNLDDINGSLREAGYARLQSTLRAFGGGGYSLRGRVLMGGEGYGWTARGEGHSNAGHSVRLGGGLGTFTVGYLLLARERANLYPVIGLGGGRVSIEMKEPAAGNSVQTRRLGTDAFIASISLNADYLLTMRRTTGGTRGLAAGIRAGYTGALTRSEWSGRGSDIIGRPDLSMSGFSLTVTLGSRRQTGPDHLSARVMPGS